MDRLLRFRCSSCNAQEVDFEAPTSCDICKKKNTYKPIFISGNTRLATEGILTEITLDASDTYDDRNDKWTDDFLDQEQKREFNRLRTS